MTDDRWGPNKFATQHSEIMQRKYARNMAETADMIFMALLIIDKVCVACQRPLTKQERIEFLHLQQQLSLKEVEFEAALAQEFLHVAGPGYRGTDPFPA